MFCGGDEEGDGREEMEDERKEREDKWLIAQSSLSPFGYSTYSYKKIRRG
jgi:hypothetical protein